MIRICHVTTVHPRNDTRIRYKECRSLKVRGFEVHLVVADGNGPEVTDGITIWDIGKPRNRIVRLLFFRSKMIKKALELDAEVYHFHDPELIFLGGALIRRGKKVIYDVHEDVPRQLLSKPYLPKLVRQVISRGVEIVENRYARLFTGIVAATPFIRDRFLKLNPRVITVQNFPLLDEFIQQTSEMLLPKKKSVCYVGGISKVRGIKNMVLAMQYVKGVTLTLGGKFESASLLDECKSLDGWEKVQYLGFLNRSQVNTTLKESVAGLVVLEPIPNYLDSIPVKMFEYMAAGIPLIASDFPYWRELLQGTDCVQFVDPLNPESIALAIDELVRDRDRAEKMGSAGQNAVYEEFNWNIEEKKLHELYSAL